MIASFKKWKIRPATGHYLLLALIALELLMSFSFFGYIHIEPISVTTVYIPVLLAGCLLGPKEAAIVGMVFGLASMWKASAFYIVGGDVFFSPFMSGQPLQSILLSVGARTLFGFTVGVLYKVVKRSKYPLIGIFFVTSLGKALHSFFVYSAMGLLFPESGFSAASTLNSVMRGDFILFLFIQNAIILPCYLFWNSGRCQEFVERIRVVNQTETIMAHDKKTMPIIIILAFLAAFGVAWYFMNRLERVMAHYGIELSTMIGYDTMHLQIQFLLGIIALFILTALAIILYQKNFNYLYHEAKLDGLTGLLSREQFFTMGEKLLEHMNFEQEHKTGYFVVLDIDYFKIINDRYGHPTGDKILVDVANRLRKILAKGSLGRLGGDEFVVLLNQPLTDDEMKALLEQLKEEVRHIYVGDKAVTCSVGAVPVTKGRTIEELYCSADRLLYEAKKNGKNQFVFGDNAC